MKALAWKKVTPSQNGNITYISPAKMTVGEEVIGAYLERLVDEGFGGFRHKLETAEGIVIINGRGKLNYLLAEVDFGNVIRIVYQGKARIASGKRKGVMAHQFEVFVQEKK